MQIRQNWPNILTLQGSLTRHWSFLYFWIGVQKLIWWRVYQWFNVSRDSQIMKGYIQRPPKDGWKALFSSSVVLGNPFSTLFCCRGLSNVSLQGAFVLLFWFYSIIGFPVQWHSPSQKRASPGIFGDFLTVSQHVNIETCFTTVKLTGEQHFQILSMTCSCFDILFYSKFNRWVS